MVTIIATIEEICTECRKEIVNIKHPVCKVEGKVERIQLSKKVLRKLCKLDTVGEVTGRILLVLLCYVGLLPLQIEGSMPLHNVGGTGDFLKKKLKWTESANSDVFTKRSAALWQLMSDKFSKAVTLCLMENLLCRMS